MTHHADETKAAIELTDDQLEQAAGGDAALSHETVHGSDPQGGAHETVFLRIGGIQVLVAGTGPQ